MENTESMISREVAKEIVRLVFFIIYYVTLIALGAAILVGSVYAAQWLVMDLLPRMRNLKLVILTVVAAVGILALAAVFGLYLIKPLFSFTRNCNDERVEVWKEDCPKLFTLLEDLARQTGFQLPKRVYLTTDVNACVFYNTGFWSIFFPVRKNLEIGLGILNSLSVQEVRAILAHEFGHFGQSSMRVGSAVAVTNQVLSNLIYSDDFIDRLLEAWCHSSWDFWSFFGFVAHVLTDLIRRLTGGVFSFVEKGYLKLSRQMEFGADAVACECAGTRAFVSAMCKIDWLAEFDGARLRSFLQSELADKRRPENYFQAHDVLVAELGTHGWPVLDPACKLTAPVDIGHAKSRIMVRDVWRSHPELADRLAHAEKLSVDVKTEAGDPAWSLVPPEIAQRVSDRYFEKLAQEGDAPEKIDADAFLKRMRISYEEQAFPRTVEDIFSRIFEPFDWEKASQKATDESPFTPEYKRLAAELQAAKVDQTTLAQIVAGEIEADEFIYDGVVYTRKTAPVEAHDKYVEGLAARVALLDARACSYLCSVGSAEERSQMVGQYRRMAEIEKCFKAFDTERAACDARLEKIFARGTRLGKAQYKKLCAEVVGLEQELKKSVQLLRDIVGETLGTSQGGASLLEYAGKDHNSLHSYDQGLFLQLQETSDLFFNECNALHRKCRLILARFAAKTPETHA